ncbi:MAG: response regulator [Candidatus Omnitrophica bacterium]|nr:response regulator [Candidatus Omnitrophota bacterium]
MARARVLVVDDEPDIRDVLRITLEGEGYEVHEAANGEEALTQLQKVNPHLILLDCKMPRMDGLEVARILKKDILLQHLPLIMLTSKGETADKVTGLEAGVDDYMVKPFEPAELVARVKMILRRTSRTLDANPLTKLPGNVSILEELQNRLDKQKSIAVCYIDLDKFKAFNDTYGFERGDEMIKATARILLTTIREIGTPDDFLGHVGGDDFVLITHPSAVDQVAQRVIAEFTKTVPSLYEEADRIRGYIEAKDRDGMVRQFKMTTISIAVVTNEQRVLSRVAEIAQIGAELKEWAKSHGGNRCVKDRRGEEPPDNVVKSSIPNPR